MKFSHFFSFIFVSTFFVGAAFAVESHEASHKKAGKKHVIKEDSSLSYSQAAPESTYSASKPMNYALGFSTIQSTIPGSTSAITGIVDFDRYNTLQAFFSIPSTSPYFNIGGAAIYKRTIAESRGAGFHVGGGLGMANQNNNFAMNLSAVGGFHFELPGLSHVMVHLDGGPTLALVNPLPGATTSLQMGALSAALGASILYVF